MIYFFLETKRKDSLSTNDRTPKKKNDANQVNKSIVTFIYVFRVFTVLIVSIK